MAIYSSSLDSTLPYKCKKCRKRFRRVSYLQHHSRIHSDQKTYTCSACDRAFRSSKQLSQHYHAHPSHRPYSCVRCNLHFSDALKFYRHRLKVHRCSQLKLRSRHTRKPPSSLPQPPTLRHSLILCLKSKSKPGSWTVSPPKPQTAPSAGTDVRLPSAGTDVRLPSTDANIQWQCTSNGDNAKSGISGSRPSPLTCRITRFTSPAKTTESLEEMSYTRVSGKGLSQFERSEFSAVVTSVDHTGASPKIKIEMSPRSPRSGRWSPRLAGNRSPRISPATISPLTNGIPFGSPRLGGKSPRAFSELGSPLNTRIPCASPSSGIQSPRVSCDFVSPFCPGIPCASPRHGSKSPRVTPELTNPLASRVACVSASSPTSIKIRFIKNEKEDALDISQQDSNTGLFKRPRQTDSPKLFTCKRNLNDAIIIKDFDADTGDMKSANKEQNEPVVKPLRISLGEYDLGKVTRRSHTTSLSRSESGESDDLPQLEKVIDVKQQKRKKSSDSDEEGCEDYEMPDDLSRHSSVDRLVDRNNSGTPMFDGTSVGSVSPPSLDRMSSTETEGPPALAKMCCTESQCHKNLGALVAIQCLGSPKDTGVSPQYLECGTAREEAASIEGSPPSNDEQAGSSPSLPSPADGENVQKSQTVATSHSLTPSRTPSRTVLSTQVAEPTSAQPIVPVPKNPPQKIVSGFLTEFTKFVASQTSQKGVYDDDKAHDKENTEQTHTCVESHHEHTQHADNYNLRPKKRKAGNYMCECCIHLPSPKKFKIKTVSPARFAEHMQRVLHLRKRVCVMLHTVFPELTYPDRFNEETHTVESLMEQVIKAAGEDECLPETGNTRHFVNWEPQVALCKSPRQCLWSLRRRICHMLSALLPTLQFEPDFDRTSRRVDKLVEDVIYLNTV